MLSKEQLAELRKPFPASAISFKCQTKPNEKGNSLVVAYIDARDVMERLDVVAFGDWQDRYERIEGQQGLFCYLTVCGITRADVGADDNENEPAKSAVSDAFKRAAVKFGVGRFLYDLPKMWAKAKPLGKSFVVEDGELERLRRSVDDFLAGKPQNKPAAKKVNADPKTGEVQSDIPDEKWQHWLDLCARADAVHVGHANPKRESTSLADLTAGFNDLKKFVQAAEAQAKSTGA